jgi:hypothetical protein
MEHRGMTRQERHARIVEAIAAAIGLDPQLPLERKAKLIWREIVAGRAHLDVVDGNAVWKIGGDREDLANARDEWRRAA